MSPISLIRLLFLYILTLQVGILVHSQVASATYNSGDLPTDRDFDVDSNYSSCPGVLLVNIPSGAYITSVDVEYDITALGGGWKSEQRSELICTSPGGVREDSVYAGFGVQGGTFSYSRSGLDIANGVSGGGAIEFELHAGRTYGGSGCGFTFNKVDNNTWTVTVHYCTTSGLWLGHSTNWNDTANWCGKTVPDISTEVVIPAAPIGGFFPVLTGGISVVCDTIMVENGASLTIENGNTLTTY